MVWQVGQQLQSGKYIIEKGIKPGGFGMTYIARDQSQRRVVIKTLNEDVQQHPNFGKFQQDFLNEALRLAKCSHPHIVKIYELFQEGILPCMVLEYIEGEDLASRVINRGILSEREALCYIQQIGDALKVVHNQGLLHRDIKPNNIMLRTNGLDAVLIDFGIAREFNPNITQNHTSFLTDYYAPIEQYDRYAKRNAFTDIYALAATLHVMLTAYEQDPDTGYLVPRFPPAPVRAAGRPLEPPKYLNRSISDRVNEAIIKGMAFRPEERPQKMQEWLELLGIQNSFIQPKIQRQVNQNNFHKPAKIKTDNQYFISTNLPYVDNSHPISNKITERSLNLKGQEALFTPIRLLAAIFLPPLGVFLQVGFGKDFWINLLLTIFGFYILGIVHAVWIIAKK